MQTPFKRYFVSTITTFVSTFITFAAFQINTPGFVFNREGLVLLAISAIVAGVRGVAKVIVEMSNSNTEPVL
jgi:hypothetical protein